MYVMMFMMLTIDYVIFDVDMYTIMYALIGYLFIGVIGNYLHHAFHIENIYLTQYKWFHELRALHYIHHLGTAKQNYGILNMSLDRILGSFSFGTKEWDTHKPRSN